MQQSESIKEIATALAKAQGEMKPAPKDATNPHFKSRYADLASIWEAIRKPLSSNGISVQQSILQIESGIAVQTQLSHTSGEWMRMAPCPIPVDKQNAQSAGSAITYGKRYSLSAAVGIVADDDDDGQEAAARPPQQRRQEPPRQEQREQPPKLATEEQLSTKDNKIIAQVVLMFSEVQSEDDFNTVCATLRADDSPPNKADNPERVKEQIKKAIRGHKYGPKKKEADPGYVPEEAAA